MLDLATKRLLVQLERRLERIEIKLGCLDNATYGANGDSLQHTTGGLLVWRKADGWTTFTDGYRTWVNGPFGIQERLNSQRFPWEAGAGP